MRKFIVQFFRWLMSIKSFRVANSLQGLLGTPPATPNNGPPVWDSQPNVSFIQGEILSFDMNDISSDPDADSITFTMNTGTATLPAGVTWTAGTGILAYDGIGTLTETSGHIITLDDGTDTTDSNSFTISNFSWTAAPLGPLTLAPPTLTAPLTITAIGTEGSTDPAELEFYRVFDTGGTTLGDHEVYRIGTFSGSPSGDLLIDLTGESSAAPIPIDIGRYVDVKFVAIHLELTEQTTAWLTSQGHGTPLGNEKWNLQNRDSNNDIGAWNVGDLLSDVNDAENIYFNDPGGYSASFDTARNPSQGWNIHPRIGGGSAIQSQHSGVLWIEGCYFDCQGQQGDCIILASNGVDPADNALDCRVNIQNTRMVNWEGQAYHKNYGDGIHGDALQSQGAGRRHSFWYENIHWESGQEGQVVTGNAPPNPEFVHLFSRNMQYINLAKATNEMNLNDYSNPGEKSGGPVMGNRNALESEEGTFGSGGRWEIENIWTSNKTSNVVNLEDTNLKVTDHAEITDGITPDDFAPIVRIGNNYTSPH